MADKTVTPTLAAKSFTCPHCGARTHQYWYSAFLRGYDKDAGPWLPAVADIEGIKKQFTDADPAEKEKLITFFERKASKVIFTDQHQDGVWSHLQLVNLNISQCFTCDKFAIWIADDLIYPNNPTSIVPNEEMPEKIRTDFIEAASIVDKSPRGAAALLRLSIQNLMVHLGLKGKKIDEDIGELVKRGLDRRIQQALDVVRVVGNSAVHPGEIDLRDNKATAFELFKLVNLIVEAMIATPKHIEEMYSALPQGKLDAIKARDNRDKG
jgi:uncharacterized protein DUF4145